jgi:hypothetical protein
VLSRRSIRKHLGRRASLLSGIGFVLCGSPGARAAAVILVPDCAVTGSGWGCYLPGILHFLVVIAIILGLILLGVIGVAVRSYFKIKHDEKVGS